MGTAEWVTARGSQNGLWPSGSSSMRANPADGGCYAALTDGSRRLTCRLRAACRRSSATSVVAGSEGLHVTACHIRQSPIRGGPIVFSHSKARSPGAPQRGAIPIRSAHTHGFRVPARAIRPLAVIVGCAAAVTITGCKPGALTGASSSSAPSAATATATGGSGQVASSAASAIAAMASNAPGVTSFVAELSIHASGRLAADLAGTGNGESNPTPLIEVRTTVPSGLEAILAGNTAYLKIGALTQTAGKPWVQAPISGLEGSRGANLAPMIQKLQASNPLAQTQMFAASTNVRESGTPMLSGVRTTEYSGSYGLEAGLARLAPSQQAGRRGGGVAPGTAALCGAPRHGGRAPAARGGRPGRPVRAKPSDARPSPPVP